MKIFIASLLAAFVSYAQAAPHAVHPSDHPAVHGMAVFGSGPRVYLSHLPLFHAPHDYQIVMEAELDLAAQKTFTQSRAANQEPLYTIAPEVFVLPDMAQAGKSFRAELYRGHFERGGTAIVAAATLKITRVIIFKKFDPAQTKSRDLDFILFGNAKEQFAAHVVSTKPDFDQILSIRTETPVEDKTIPFTVSGAPNAPVTAKGLANVESKAVPELKSLKIGPALYTETGDLSF